MITKLDSNSFFKFLTVMFFLLPSSSFVGGLGLWYLILLCSGVFFSIYFVSRKLTFNFVLLASSIIFILLTTFASLALSYEYFVLDDFFEIIRVFSLLVFLTGGYFLSNDKTFTFLLSFFPFYLLFQLVVSILQKSEVIKATMSLVWNMDKAWSLRSTGTLGNPNVLALMCILSMLFVYFFSAHKKVKISCFVMCTAIVFLSGSRTGLISYFATVIFMLFVSGNMRFFTVLKKLSVVILFGCVSLFGLFALASELRYLGELLEVVEGGGFDLTQIGTFAHRLGAWERQYHLFLSKGELGFLLGVGPAKDIGFRVMDNDYLAQFLKYGLLGMLSNLTLLISILFVSFSTDRLYSNTSRFIACLLVCYSVFSFTASTYLSLLNMIPVMLLVGFFIKSSYIYETQSKYNLSCSQSIRYKNIS